MLEFGLVHQNTTSMGVCWSGSLKKGRWSRCIRPRGKQYLASELGGGKVILITTTDKWDEKLAEAKHKAQLVVVNFSAAWSTPCRFIATVYRHLADKHDSLMFLTVDVDKLPEFSASWNVKATPTFFFLKNGQPIDSFVCADEKDLAKKIEAAAAGFIKVQ